MANLVCHNNCRVLELKVWGPCWACEVLWGLSRIHYHRLSQHSYLHSLCWITQMWVTDMDQIWELFQCWTENELCFLRLWMLVSSSCLDADTSVENKNSIKEDTLGLHNWTHRESPWLLLGRGEGLGDLYFSNNRFLVWDQLWNLLCLSWCYLWFIVQIGRIGGGRQSYNCWSSSACKACTSQQQGLVGVILRHWYICLLLYCSCVSKANLKWMSACTDLACSWCTVI